MGKIKDLPILERPREKALRYGIDSLSNHELLALIIGSGSPENSAMDIAYQMLSDSHGLFHLVRKPYFDLLNYKGVGEIKAVKIIATFELARRFLTSKEDEEEFIKTSDEIFKKYQPIVANLVQEHVYLVVLDNKKKVLHEVNLYRGNENSVTCSEIQIVQQVIIHSGHYFYLIHNHPSGALTPSEEDVMFTTNLIRRANKLRVILLDHIIISNRGYYSFLNNVTKKS